jgi:hypothetical protein
MRPSLPRILLNTAAVMSLSLCAATAVSWSRSYSHARASSVNLWGVEFVLNSMDGLMGVAVQTGSRRTLAYWSATEDWPHGHQPKLRNLVTFGADLNPIYPRGTSVALTLPHWAALAILGCMGALFRTAARCKSTDDRRLCPTCNYDLRATPDRCPACGHTHTLPASAP